MRKTDTSINLNQPVSKYGRHQSTVLNLGISYSQTVNSNFFNCCRIPKTPLIRKQVWINSTLLLWTKNATAPGSPKSTRSTDKLVVGELAGVYCKSKGKVGVNVVTIHDCCVLRSCQRSLSPSYLFRALGVCAFPGLRPRRTLRTVLWTAEEQGGVGARQYYDQHKVPSRR